MEKIVKSNKRVVPNKRVGRKFLGKINKVVGPNKRVGGNIP